MLQASTSMPRIHSLLCLSTMLSLGACSAAEGDDDGRMLRILLDVDPDQVRLDNFGDPAPEPPAGHAVQNPDFLLVGAHSAELVPSETTQLGEGAQVFDSAHRDGAVDFAELPVVEPGGELIAVPLADVDAGTYEYLRVSVSYQRYQVVGHADYMGIDVAADVEVASFVESQTYIDSYEIGDQVVEVGGVKKQGYYGAWSQYTGVVQGQAPAGATTVPNPLDDTSPIPVDSCVVTAVFDEPLVVGDAPDGDLVLTVTLSTNGSFEWEDNNGDGDWQPYAESVVDMGLRGMQVEVGG